MLVFSNNVSGYNSSTVNNNNNNTISRSSVINKYKKKNIQLSHSFPLDVKRSTTPARAFKSSVYLSAENKQFLKSLGLRLHNEH